MRYDNTLFCMTCWPGCYHTLRSGDRARIGIKATMVSWVPPPIHGGSRSKKPSPRGFAPGDDGSDYDDVGYARKR